MMKIAALAVSTAPGGNMSFAFSKSVPIAPAKGRGKRTPAWTNRRAKALVPCGFADAKTEYLSVYILTLKYDVLLRNHFYS